MIEVIQYIDSCIQNGEAITAKQCARKFNYEPSYFSRMFRKFMGCSISSYLTASKMEKAVAQLLEGKKVYMIHEGLHYSSSSSFSRGFKTHMGMSPYQFQTNAVKTQQKVQEILTFSEPRELLYTRTGWNNSLKGNNQLTIQLNYDTNFAPKIFFVGLYHERLALGNPLIGKGLFYHDVCTFEGVPDGDYFVLVNALEDAEDIQRTFLARNNLKGCTLMKQTLKSGEHKRIAIDLAKDITIDLPAVINFPLLVDDLLKSQLRTS